jgi:hypothetical protein
MNLVQIQERLKDLPLQAIMSYANGQNPQVPPYLALGEMNRRKKMEQQAAQPPKATVKENLEQQMGVMQLQKMQQGQPMAQPAMQQPQDMPEAMPQPEAEMAMAAGGVARLPMHLDFASGGIIAFANPEGKQLVESDEDKATKDLQTEIEYRERDERRKRLEADRAKSMADVANQTFIRDGMQNDPRLVGKTPRAETLGTLASPANNVPSGGIATVVPAAVNVGGAKTLQKQNANANPVAPVMSEAQKFQEKILAGTGLPALPTEYVPPKQAPIGEDMMSYLTAREQKRREDALKFEDVQKARDKRDFFNSLIQGAEASRGQRGLAALVGGTGRALGEAATAAEERRMTFDKAQQDLADNDAKTRFEIANLRRAEERGDAKAVYDSKVKIGELTQQRVQLQGQVANQMAGNESAERVARANNLTQLEVARINQASANRPGETERLLMQYAELKRTKGEAAAEEFMKTIERTKFGNKPLIASENNAIKRLQLLDKDDNYKIQARIADDPKQKPEARARAREIMDAIERRNGIIDSSSGPAIGSVQDGYRFKGGNPADKNNWEKV